ncbi:hypothetical protein FRAHR75_1090013 [Frankia sp. Hr75.2]|nr:hypothetical protein FRAHR75_1090013 [Frankia sp. Hr75.2]
MWPTTTTARPPRRRPDQGTDQAPACPRRLDQRIRTSRLKPQVTTGGRVLAPHSVTIAHLMFGDQPGEPDPAVTDWLIDVAVHRGDTSPILLRRHDDMMEITEKRDPYPARWNGRGHAHARLGEGRR